MQPKNIGHKNVPPREQSVNYKSHPNTKNFGQSVEEETKVNFDPLKQSYNNQQNFSGNNIGGNSVIHTRILSYFKIEKDKTISEISDIINNMDSVILWDKIVKFPKIGRVTFNEQKEILISAMNNKIKNDLLLKTTTNIDIMYIKSIFYNDKNVSLEDKINLLKKIDFTKEEIICIEKEIRTLSREDLIDIKEFASTIYEKIYNNLYKIISTDNDKIYIKEIINCYLDMIKDLNQQNIKQDIKSAKSIISIVAPLINRYAEDRIEDFVNKEEPRFNNPNSIIFHAGKHQIDTTFLFGELNTNSEEEYQKMVINLLKDSMNNSCKKKILEVVVGETNRENFIDFGLITQAEIKQNKSNANVKIYLSIPLNKDGINFKTLFKSDNNDLFNHERAGENSKSNYQAIYDRTIAVK